MVTIARDAVHLVKLDGVVRAAKSASGNRGAMRLACGVGVSGEGRWREGEGEKRKGGKGRGRDTLPSPFTTQPLPFGSR